MNLIDTHTHLYLQQFDEDRDQVIETAKQQGIKQMFLPNIDSSSIDDMLALSEKYPENCYPMMGLHPTSVKENYEEELELVKQWLQKGGFCAVGEIGIDLYWDKTFQEQQEDAFRLQIRWAKANKLPIAIHTRNSFGEVQSIVKEEHTPDLRGVFHCFSGNTEQARKVIEMNFLLGIGGVLTFKNSGLDKVVREISLEHFILETDSPFLAPVPYRGKRNESAYIRIIAQKLADIKGISIEEVAEATSNNSLNLFKTDALNHE